MDKRIVYGGIGVVVLIAVGAGAWWFWKPFIPPPPASLTPPPAVSYTPVEQYQQKLASIKQEYETSSVALGATTQERVAKKQQWLTILQTTFDRVLRLSVPNESREVHQNRIIAIYTLMNVLRGSSGSNITITQYEAAIAKLWE